MLGFRTLPSKALWYLHVPLKYSIGYGTTTLCIHASFHVSAFCSSRMACTVARSFTPLTLFACLVCSGTFPGFSVQPVRVPDAASEASTSAGVSLDNLSLSDLVRSSRRQSQHSQQPRSQ